MIIDRSHPPKIELSNNVNCALPEKLSLTNGSPLYIIEDKTQPLSLLSLTFRLGYTEGKPAVGYFASKMLTRGTLTKTAEEVADMVETWGGSLSTVIERDTMTITVNVLSRFLDDAIAIMAECLWKPAFDIEECEKFKIKTLADIERIENDPQALAYHEAEKHLFENHKYSTPWYGSKEEMAGVTKQDCTEWHSVLLKRKCSVIAAGDVSTDEIKQTIEKYFGDLNNSDEAQSSGEEMKNVERSVVYGVHRNDSLQTTLVIGLHIPFRTHKDFIALRFLCSVLGEGLSSRLTIALREEKAYTYGAGAMIDDGIYGSVLFISTSVGNEVTGDTVAEIFRQVKRLQSELIPDEELERNKQTMIGKTLFSSETPRQRAYLAQYCEANNLPLTYFNDRIDAIRRLTSEQLLHIADKYLQTDNMLIAATGVGEVLQNELQPFGKVHIKQL